MSEYCVVVAGGSKARIFKLQAAELPQLQPGPRLVEQVTLLAREPEPPAPSARKRGARGPVRGYGGHQAPQRRDSRRLARDIAEQLDQMLPRKRKAQLVVCAEKRTLGRLRPGLNEALAGIGQLQLREVPKDFARLSSHELHHKLAREGHLPRPRPSHARS